ncbi:MAG: hypothetical protein ACRBFS_14220 [Aureispira sp.]
MYIRLFFSLVILFFGNFKVFAQKTITPYFYNLDYEEKKMYTIDFDSLFIATPNLKSFGFVSYKKKNRIKDKLKISDFLCDLDSLEYIKISVNNAILPKCLNSMQYIKYLDLHTDSIFNGDVFFDDMSEMDSLKILRITAPNCTKTSIFSTIATLPNVRGLYLNIPKVNNISSDVGSMDSLNSLFIITNELLEIPKTLSNLKQLEQLGLCFNWNNGANFSILAKLPILEKLSDESKVYYKYLHEDLRLLLKLEELFINTDFSEKETINTLSALSNLKKLHIEVTSHTSARIAENIVLLKEIDKVFLLPQGFWTRLKANRIRRKVERLTNGEVQLRVGYINLKYLKKMKKK